MFSSVQVSRSVGSNSLWHHGLQHTRPPCTSPIPRVHSNSRPSCPWCHPAISSSVVPFSSCPQSLPTSEFFPMSQLFAWGGQSAGVSALASFLPKKSQGWPSSEWTDWISLQSSHSSLETHSLVFCDYFSSEVTSFEKSVLIHYSSPLIEQDIRIGMLGFILVLDFSNVY